MRKVLAIAMDAADAALIEKWTNDGTLPTLKKLREQGSYGRLTSPAEWMTGSSWPTFYTGKNPANHGFYNYLVWNAEKMITEQPSPDRMPLRPFWRDLKDPNGPRVMAVDLPLTYGAEPLNGCEVISFATHDVLVPMTGYPPEFIEKFRARYGSQIMSNERYGRQSKKEFAETGKELLQVTKKMGDLCLDLMQEYGWDLFLTSFATTHRGGHRLWKTHNIPEELSDSEKAQFSDSLRQIYIACDHEIARLIEAAGPGTAILIFALHGMGDNTTLTPILPEMLRRVVQNEKPDASSPRPDLLSRLRASISLDIRHRIKQSLPVTLRHKLTAFWRRNTESWDKTPAFSMMADMQGWIRINLKGREKLGIVHPGREYDELCARIADGLRTFNDAETGQPVIQSIVRSSQVFEGEKLDMLPDLIVQWKDHPVHLRRAVHSERYGEISIPMAGYNSDGRSGNHLPQGMLIAAGEGAKSGNIGNGHILDLAPTILHLLGQPIPPEMEGKILPIFKD